MNYEYYQILETGKLITYKDKMTAKIVSLSWDMFCPPEILGIANLQIGAKVEDYFYWQEINTPKNTIFTGLVSIYDLKFYT